MTAPELKRKQSERRQRTTQVGVRLTPDEMRTIRFEADARGVTVPQLLRLSYFGP